MNYFLNFKGDNKNQVHMEGYQVTYQCMALVRDGCLVPTKDAPELGYVVETSEKKFVPDVYYKVRSTNKFTFFLSALKLKQLRDKTHF